MQKKLEQFHCAFGHPIGKQFKQEDLTLPVSLINEEYQELVDWLARFPEQRSILNLIVGFQE